MPALRAKLRHSTARGKPRGAPEKGSLESYGGGGVLSREMRANGRRGRETNGRHKRGGGADTGALRPTASAPPRMGLVPTSLKVERVAAG